MATNLQAVRVIVTHETCGAAKDIVFYGPYPCPNSCGAQIVMTAKAQGGDSYEVPQAPIYPNSAWPIHRCPALDRTDPTMTAERRAEIELMLVPHLDQFEHPMTAIARELMGQVNWLRCQLFRAMRLAAEDQSAKQSR